MPNAELKLRAVEVDNVVPQKPVEDVDHHALEDHFLPFFSQERVTMFTSDEELELPQEPTDGRWRGRRKAVGGALTSLRKLLQLLRKSGLPLK